MVSPVIVIALAVPDLVILPEFDVTLQEAIGWQPSDARYL